MKPKISFFRIIVVSLLAVILFLFNRPSLPFDNKTVEKVLDKVMLQLELLKKQNEKFTTLLVDFKRKKIDGRLCTDETHQQLQQNLDNANNIFKNDVNINDNTIVESLSGSLMGVHGDPTAGRMDQLVKYLVRHQQHFKQYIEELMVKMDFQKPIVGVQMRQMDEVKSEHTFVSIDEFMNHVTDYHANSQLKGVFSESHELIKKKEELIKELIKIGLCNRSSSVQEKQQLNKIKNNDEYYEASFEVERLHRRIYKGVKELWHYLSSELKRLKAISNENLVQQKIDEILEDGAEHKRVISADFYNLSRANGRFEWVKKEIKELEEIVEKRLIALQNPTDCNSAKKVICNLNHNCGFGCELHHAAYCLHVAYGTQRTLILNATHWFYNTNSWENVFQPVSNTCVSAYGSSQSSWPPIGNPQVIVLPFEEIIDSQPPFLPLAIPEDLSGRLLAVHGDPSVWWIGQFVKYLMRPNRRLTQYFKELMNKMDFQKPIVGVHVRRTDKIKHEAIFFSIDEYMDHVIDYYAYLQLLKGEVGVKRVYLATDDPTVFDEAKKKYPEYVFVGNAKATKLASMRKRYSNDALFGIIGDIYMLMQTDYVVCTFSSNICRLVYELKQTFNPDASDSVHSLDFHYFFTGQQFHYQRVLYFHIPRPNSTDMELKRGDIVRVAGDYFNGIYRNLNTRTGKTGTYPTFIAEDVIPLFNL